MNDVVFYVGLGMLLFWYCVLVFGWLSLRQERKNQAFRSPMC